MKKRTRKSNSNFRNNSASSSGIPIINAFKEAESIAVKIFGIFEKSSEDITTSFASAFSYVQQMVSLIQSIQSTASILSSIFSFVPGGNIIGGLLEGGGRASGGPVTASIPYVVGEEGPELFVPDSNGFIVPGYSFQNYLSSYNEAVARDNNIALSGISNHETPNITVIVQSEVEATKAVRFFSNHLPVYENRRGKENFS